VLQRQFLTPSSRNIDGGGRVSQKRWNFDVNKVADQFRIGHPGSCCDAKVREQNQE